MRPVYIYGLVDPRTPGVVHYVGKANDVAHRHKIHLWNARHGEKINTRLIRWMQALLAEGVVPEITVLEETPSALWEDAERKWISYWREANVNLFNLMPGGNGVLNCSAETRRRMSEAHTGTKHSEETRRRISQGQIGNRRGDSTRRRISAARMGVKPWNKGIARTAEERLAISKACRTAWAKKRNDNACV